MMAAIVAVAFNFIACNNENDEPSGPGTPSVDPSNPTDPSGNQGADAEEITVAQAIEIANALEPKAKTDKNYKVTVTLTKVFTASDKIASYGNINCEVKDETGTISCYYTNNLGNTKFTSADQVPAIGSKLVIVGPLKLYAGNNGNTPEFENAWIEEILEQGSGEEPTPSVDPTDAQEVTVAEAIAIANALEPKGKTTQNYKVTAVLTKVFTASDKIASYGNINCEVKDETGTIGCYYTNNLGNTKFTSADQVPPLGSKLVIVGPLKLYAGNNGNTPEFENAYIAEILEVGNGEVEPDPSEEPIETGENIVDYLLNAAFETVPDGFVSEYPTNGKVEYNASENAMELKGSTSANARIHTQSLTLAAGTYVITVNAKAGEEGAKLSIGYTLPKEPKEDGTPQYEFKYVKEQVQLTSEYADIQGTFTLAAETEVTLIAMNQGKTGKSVLIKEVKLDKAAQ